MITKSFIFLLLLHISNASYAEETHNNLTNFLKLAKTFESNHKAGKHNDITYVQLAKKFEDSCLEPGGLLLSKKRICIPEEHKLLIQYPPTMNWGDLQKCSWCSECSQCYTPTILNFTIGSVEVVEIDVDALTISMNLKTFWKDQRPVLMTRTSLEIIHLGMDEEKEIWLPRIGIWSNRMSQNIQRKQFCLRKSSNSTTYGAEVLKDFSITTKVKCAMDFQTFPFDKHSCILEVNFSIFPPQIRLFKRYLPLHLVE